MRWRCSGLCLMSDEVRNSRSPLASPSIAGDQRRAIHLQLRRSKRQRRVNGRSAAAASQLMSMRNPTALSGSNDRLDHCDIS
jgi:hypothetical protein